MSGYHYVSDSHYRTWETRETPDNWYGRVLHDGIPVICGHGGSMWLCASCGQRILERENDWAFPPVPAVARES